MLPRAGGPALYERQLRWLAHRRGGLGSGKIEQCACHVLATAHVRQSHYLRSLDVAEPCSPNVDSRVRFQGDVADFSPNVFSFPVAVGPDEQDLGMSGLGFDVPRYGFPVL